MGGNIVVEFVGPPAAGKTTLSKAVGQELKKTGYNVHLPATKIAEHSTFKRIVTKVPIAIQWFVSKPTTTVPNTFFILRSNQKDFRNYTKLVLNWHLVCGLHSRSNAEVTLLDQGVFQALWAIGYESELGWEEAIRCVEVPESAIPDIVVVVKTDEHVLADRLGPSHESKARVSRSNQENIRRAIQGANLVSDLLNEYAERSQVEYIKIDNSRDKQLDDLVNSIVQSIIKYS